VQARSKKIVLSLTAHEKLLLLSLAQYEGRLSLNAMVRHLIADAVRQRGILAQDCDPEMFAQENATSDE
jgi:hypothetical protein